MKPISLKDTAQWVLLASLMCGVGGIVHAQIRGGAGQAGSMGQQGAPTGEFPPLPQSSTPGQHSNPPSSPPMPSHEVPAKNSSGTQVPSSSGQGPGVGPNPQLQPRSGPRRD
jgi:hypothetical protein